MAREPASIGSYGIPGLDMRSFLAWYQVYIVGALVIIVVVPFFHAILRVDCENTIYAFTFMAWVFGPVSITGTPLPLSCLTPYSGILVIVIFSWLLQGMMVVVCMYSIRMLHKKPGPTLVKIRSEVWGCSIGFLILIVILNALSLLASGYSPAGLALSIPAAILYIRSKRLYLTKEQIDERRRRIAEIQQDVIKEIIAGHQDALLNEIQDLMADVTAANNGYEVIEAGTALSKRIQFMAGILRSLREHKSVSITSLKAACTTDNFPAMILDLCQQFNLAIQGDTIQLSPASSIDPDDLLNGIDKMFATWRGNEAAKLAKI